MKDKIIEMIDREILDWADLLCENDEDKEYYAGCIKSLNSLKKELILEYGEVKKPRDKE